MLITGGFDIGSLSQYAVNKARQRSLWQGHRLSDCRVKLQNRETED